MPTETPDLPLGWQTDLAVQRLAGAVVIDHGDHLVVRSPHNPDFHWGNLVVVTDGAAVDDADRWVATYERCFPDAGWLAIGLARLPDDLAAWQAHGLEPELDEVLATDALPLATPRPEGYDVRRLAGPDWEDHLAKGLEANERSGEHPAEEFRRFATAQRDTRRSLSEQDLAAFFGAYDGDRLVADLGIVRCGNTARYQSVGTRPEHRRRGLAAHLLGVAARWSAQQGCTTWVIITEATNPAGRVYRSVGFAPVRGNAQVYRPPGQSS